MLDTRRRYEDAVDSGDTAAATAIVDEMLTAGAQPVTVLTDVIAAAQRAVGARWQRGEWTVAQEHAATAMAVDATKTVTKHVRRTPPTRGRIIVACAEREWHALPAMIIDCALRGHGWDTTLLGSSTSALRLNQYLHDLGPEAVAVSCSVLGALPTTRRFIEASTAAGVPIVVGGAAFGHDDQRARALGATAWARDAHGAVTAMYGLPAVVSPASPLPADSAGEQAALETRPPAVGRDAACGVVTHRRGDCRGRGADAGRFGRCRRRAGPVVACRVGGTSHGRSASGGRDLHVDSRSDAEPRCGHRAGS